MIPNFITFKTTERVDPSFSADPNYRLGMRIGNQTVLLQKDRTIRIVEPPIERIAEKDSVEEGMFLKVLRETFLTFSNITRITSLRGPSEKRDWTRTPNTLTIYASAPTDADGKYVPLYRASEEFSDKHRVMAMDHKCHPYAAIQRVELAETAAEIERALGQNYPGLDIQSVKFSAKAGCSCGCSPGYIALITNPPSELQRSHMWMDVVLPEISNLRINVAHAKSELAIALNPNA